MSIGIVEKVRRNIRLLREELTSRGSILIDREVDTDIERMKMEKIREWKAKGYSEHLIDMATRLSQEWVVSMSKAFAPTMPEVQEAIIRATFPKALEVGDRWIREMAK
jgi:hypothetical protein